MVSKNSPHLPKQLECGVAELHADAMQVSVAKRRKVWNVMIQGTGICKSFDDLQVLKNVNFTVENGDIYGLVGRSGAGKSTLLRCINGLLTFEKGDLTVDGVHVNQLKGNELRAFQKNIGMIFQHFAILDRKTVYENIQLPIKWAKVPKEAMDARIKELIELVGMTEKAHTAARNLSGGQKQRVAIARALALNPKILLCDEATSALDPSTTQSILELLLEINQKFGITMVMVTHQMSVVQRVCNKMSILEDGEIRDSGQVEELFKKQSPALIKLLGEEQESFEGKNIELFLSEKAGEDELLAKIAIETGVPYKIKSGKLDKYRDGRYGRFVINFPDNDETKMLECLKKHGIDYKVLGKGQDEAR